MKSGEVKTQTKNKQWKVAKLIRKVIAKKAEKGDKNNTQVKSKTWKVKSKKQTVKSKQKKFSDVDIKMTFWQLALYCAFVLVKLPNAQTEIQTPLLPGKSVISIIPELLGLTGTAAPGTSTENLGLESREQKSVDKYVSVSDEIVTEPISTTEVRFDVNVYDWNFDVK